MKTKFNAYLDETFKHLPYSKGARDLKEEMLANLLERAEELKQEGLLEEEIYTVCIESLGDYTEAINALKRKPNDFIRDTKMWGNLLFVICFILCSVVVYVCLGVFMGIWGKGALIVFPSMLGVIFITYSILRLNRNIKLKRHAVSGVIIALNIILYITALFFILWGAVGVKAKYAWTVFTFIPLGVTVAHLITQKLLRGKKIWLITWLLLIVVIALPIFLTVSMFSALWHPLWIIMVIAVIVDVFILSVYLLKKRRF